VTEVWEEQRPHLPQAKHDRALLLGTADPPWQELVDFHLNRLGCRFCRANWTICRKRLRRLGGGAGQDPALDDRVLSEVVP
jgi:hypothetical protein